MIAADRFIHRIIIFFINVQSYSTKFLIYLANFDIISWLHGCFICWVTHNFVNEYVIKNKMATKLQITKFHELFFHIVCVLYEIRKLSCSHHYIKFIIFFTFSMAKFEDYSWRRNIVNGYVTRLVFDTSERTLYSWFLNDFNQVVSSTFLLLI